MLAGAREPPPVRVRGTAQNDKLSAVLEARGVTVYCLDLAHWPADRIGKPATIEGTIERTDQFAAHRSDGLASRARRARSSRFADARRDEQLRRHVTRAAARACSRGARA
jgi:hypothetical protein